MSQDKIEYPTIDLYLYDLRDDLGQNPKILTEKRDAFLKKIIDGIPKKLPTLPIEENQDNDNLEDQSFCTLLRDQGNIPWQKSCQDNTTEDQYWLGKDTLNFKTKLSNPEGFVYQGNYLPVRINDTYGLLLDCSIEEPQEPVPIDSLKSLKKQINQRISNRASLGETWIISVATDSNDKQIIAKKCYQVFLSDHQLPTQTDSDHQLPTQTDSDHQLPTQTDSEKLWSDNLQGEGNILGGVFFDLWSKNLAEQLPHVIIIVYPDKNAINQSAKLDRSWLPLLCYRHKIIYAYCESRQLKANLKGYFHKIYESIGDIQQTSMRDKRLTDLHPVLDEAQKTMCEYSLGLTSFEYQKKTLEINLDNYQARLKLMLSKIEPNDNLKGLEEFTNWATNKYLKQLEKDLDNLTPGKTLLESLLNSINSVKTIIEIKQAQRDRNFQNTVGIIGIALACAAIIASISTQFPNVVAPVTIFPADSPQPVVESTVIQVLKTLKTPESWYVPFSSLAFSLTGGIISGALAGIILLKGKGKFISIMISLIVLFVLVKIIF